MRMTARTAITWAFLAVCAPIAPVSAQSGPVILDLGPVEPTPAPTPRDADKLRLVSTVTVQNNAEGESVISFEVQDVADEGDERIRPIAFKTYSLAAEGIREAPPEARPLGRRIVEMIRDIEREMLEYAEIAGPPKERKPLVE